MIPISLPKLRINALSRADSKPGLRKVLFDNTEPQLKENPMKNLSINIKLILLVGLGLVFVGAVVVIETISNSSIKKTNNENFAMMEQANRDYREKALAAQERLDQIQDVLNSVQYARIAEKSYLQFYNPQYEKQLDEHVNHALDILKKIDKNKSTETLDNDLTVVSARFR